MKRILYGGLAGFLLAFCFSCVSIDNYGEPDAELSGKIIDSTTGGNLITGPGEFNVRIWETSWTIEASPQDLYVQQDGTYVNRKLFKATYDVQPYGGPFWPVEKISGVELKGKTEQDFTVTPYLRIVDVTPTLDGANLTLSCRLACPRSEDLPQVREIRPFVSLTPFVGNGNKIDEYNNDRYRIEVSKSWSDLGPAGGVSNDIFTLPVLPLKPGRTFYVRIGARVRDTFEKYNYSEVLEIKVP
jgi:hypothetical protein